MRLLWRFVPIALLLAVAWPAMAQYPLPDGKAAPTQRVPLLIGLSTQDILARYGRPSNTRIENDGKLSWGMGAKTPHRIAGLDFDPTTKRCVFAKFWFSKGPRLVSVLPSNLVNVEPLITVSAFPDGAPGGKRLEFLLEHSGRWVAVSIGQGYGRAFSVTVPRIATSERFNPSSGMNEKAAVYDYNSWRNWGGDFTISQEVLSSGDEDAWRLAFWKRGSRSLYRIVDQYSGRGSWSAYASISHSLQWHGVYGSKGGPSDMMLRAQAAERPRQAIDDVFNVTGSPDGDTSITIRH